MLNMSQINDIREKVKAGYSISEIARELGVDKKTVRKYRNQHDYSPKQPIVKECQQDRFDFATFEGHEWSLHGVTLPEFIDFLMGERLLPKSSRMPGFRPSKPATR